MIRRKKPLQAIQKHLKTFPVVGLLGPRQCGKTTLANQIGYDHFFDLENPSDLAKLEEPQLVLENLKGTIVIDEIQRKPNLFTLLRYLVDHNSRQKYLILGSASRDLIRQSAESLAGRIGYFYLGGLSLEEVGINQINQLWFKGGYPRSYLAKTNPESSLWRKNYITTLLERDIPQLGIAIPAVTLRRFWMMLSHYHGQILNYSELGRSFGISDVTVKKYTDILVGTFMMRLLPSWQVNLGKRLVKNPKIYLRDSGLFHTLQNIESFDQLSVHPKLGAAWEGFALEQAIYHLELADEEIFFWATHSGAELDLFWQRGGKRWGMEFKYVDAPKRTRSMLVALEDLQLEHLWVVYPGKENYPLDKKITAVALRNLSNLSEK